MSAFKKVSQTPGMKFNPSDYDIGIGATPLRSFHNSPDNQVAQKLLTPEQEPKTQPPPSAAKLGPDNPHFYVRLAEWDDMHLVGFEYGVYYGAFTIVLAKHPFTVFEHECTGLDVEGPIIRTNPSKDSKLTPPGSMLLKVFSDCTDREDRSQGWNWSAKWLGSPKLQKLMTGLVDVAVDPDQPMWDTSTQDEIIRKFSERLDLTSLVKFLSTDRSVTRHVITPNSNEGVLYKHHYKVGSSVDSNFNKIFATLGLGLWESMCHWDHMKQEFVHGCLDSTGSANLRLKLGILNGEFGFAEASATLYEPVGGVDWSGLMEAVKEDMNGPESVFESVFLLVHPLICCSETKETKQVCHLLMRFDAIAKG